MQRPLVLPSLAWLTWALVAAGLVTFASGWRTDNRVVRWVGQLGEDPDWQLFREGFGGDEVVLLRFRGGALEDPVVLRELHDGLRDLGDQAAVERVVEPWSMAALERPGRAAGAGEDPGALARPSDLARSDIVRELDLVDAAVPRLDTLLALGAEASPEDRARLLAALRDLLLRAEALGLDPSAAGHPLVAAALDEEAQRVERRFAPALALLAALACGAFLRSVRLALACLLPAVIGSALPRAALRGLGIDSDLILVTLGPLGFVLLLASALHVVVAFRALRREHPVDVARSLVRRRKAPASLLAAVTTAAGFAALASGDLESVAVLGLCVAATVLFLVPAMLVGTPPLLGCPAPGPGRRAPGRRTEALARFAVRHARGVVLVTAALLVGGGLAFRHLPEQTDTLQYFPRHHPVRADFERLEAEGAALSSLEVLVAPPTGESWTAAQLSDPAIDQALASVPGVRGVVGPRLLRHGLLPLSLAARSAGRLDASGRWARWSVRIPTADARSTEALVGQLERALDDLLGGGPHPRHRLTGSLLLMLRMQDHLLRTLVGSLAWTALVSGLGFLLVTRRLRELLAALVTNLAPVALVLLGSWGFDLPLDGATVMVAAVVLGLAVDNTFHLLHAGRGGDRERGLSAFRSVGTAAWVSSLALTLGFAALACSGFAPTARFGGLCALGSLGALAADLVVLPALWLGELGPTRRVPSHDKGPAS